MDYKNKEFLLLLIPILILFIWHFVSKKKKNPTLLHPLTGFLLERMKGDKGSIQSQQYRKFFLWLPTVLFASGIVLMVFALARPQTSDTKVKRNFDGIDIMIAMDISDSMLIEDMKPYNRLEAAKETIKQFVQKRSSDRIGIIVFAGEAFTLVPLTLDYDLILKRVSEISTARKARIKDGTALGVALANAAGRLKESTAKSRVIIFMTDGENNSGTIDPDTGLEIAKGFGHKVYSIGIGRDGPTRIPVYIEDNFGNSIKQYQPFESTVNEELLNRMASETGGKYFRASKEDSLAGIFSEIDRLEKTKVEVNRYTRYNEHYTTYLNWALCLFLLGLLLSETILRRRPV